jgi:hypothetical protein
VSPPRIWTVAEARAALPRVRELLLVLQRAATLASQVRSNGHAALHASDPDSTQGSDGGAEDELKEIGAGGIQPILDGLEDLGIVLRDPARGLIDFPAVHLGRQVQLCWQLGEEDIGWWHLPEEGFAGRHPLPLPESW